MDCSTPGCPVHDLHAALSTVLLKLMSIESAPSTTSMLTYTSFWPFGSSEIIISLEPLSNNPECEKQIYVSSHLPRDGVACCYKTPTWLCGMGKTDWEQQWTPSIRTQRVGRGQGNEPSPWGILKSCWICFNVASVLCFGFLALRHAGS